MNQEYLNQLKKQKEKLEKLKQENNSQPLGKEKPKTKQLLNGSIKAFEEPTMNKNGYISALLLGFISFVTELLFIGISILINK